MRVTHGGFGSRMHYLITGLRRNFTTWASHQREARGSSKNVGGLSPQLPESGFEHSVARKIARPARSSQFGTEDECKNPKRQKTPITPTRRKHSWRNYYSAATPPAPRYLRSQRPETRSNDSSPTKMQVQIATHPGGIHALRRCGAQFATHDRPTPMNTSLAPLLRSAASSSLKSSRGHKNVRPTGDAAPRRARLLRNQSARGRPGSGCATTPNEKSCILMAARVLKRLRPLR
jgi:hypothetical protein